MNQFSRGQSLSTFDIQDRKVFDVIQEVGGSQLSRWVVVNATSIFSIEPLKEDKATSAAGATSPTPPPQQQQGTLRSQRSLLEIGRVTFLQNTSFTVHFKSSYGGDQVTYLYKEPMEVVKAIQDALGILGVKGKHTSNASGGGGGGGSSALKQTRIQGGSFRERPRDAIRRLEDEMKVRPTLAIVRGIMDRYRRLIDACVSDPSHAAEKEAERLMHALQQFLMREDVERTLNSETQILHQRERSEEEIVVERERERSASLSRDRAASEAKEEKEEEEAKASLRSLSSFLEEGEDGEDGEVGEEGEEGEEERKNQENQEKKKKKEDNVDDDGSNDRTDPMQKQEQKQEKQKNQGSSKTAVMTSMGRGIMVDSREDGVRTVELDWAIMYSRDPSIITVLEDDSELSQVATSTTTSNDDKERISDDELNLLMKDYEEDDTLTTKGKGEEWEDITEESEESNSDFVGIPYHRSPGEVYLSQVPDSQINHARVAEQGYFLGSGKVQTDYRYERTEEEERRLSGPGR